MHLPLEARRRGRRHATGTLLAAGLMVVAYGRLASGASPASDEPSQPATPSQPAPPSLPATPILRAPPSAAEIAKAVSRLRADPDLGGSQKTKTLRWVSGTARRPAGSAAWLVQLFEYIADTGRLLLWVAGAVGAGIVGVWLYRVIGGRSVRVSEIPASVASHVQDLDIRPESLPADVGAAARALLEAGRTREALSLLYRGALSRVVHGFGVPIEAAYTEGEVLRVVNARLDAPRSRYFAKLVGVWQRSVYGGQNMPGESLLPLCTEFAVALGDAPI